MTRRLDEPLCRVRTPDGRLIDVYDGEYVDGDAVVVALYDETAYRGKAFGSAMVRWKR